MESIFKINLEPNLNYENVNLIQIKNKLKDLRLNISEEIKCLSFIKQNINKENINKDENFDINEALVQKYSLILNKLNELCIEEINYISETIIILDEKIKKNKTNNEIYFDKDDNIYDKIDLTINNYNKIIDNINKTISSLPYIFNLYLAYNNDLEEENNFIRNNIEKEEEKYGIEIKKLNKKKKVEKYKFVEKKENNATQKREKMMKFNESLKNLNTKKNSRIKNNKNENSKINSSIEIKKNNLNKKVNEIELEKDELKNFVFKNCIKENEIKNFNKIKEDNKILNDEILKLKNIIKELKERYEYQNQKLEKLKNERLILENENFKLIEYVNKIFSEEEKNNDFDKNSDKNNNINTTNNSNYIKNDEENAININPNNFESIEMFKRLNKL